MPSISSPGIGSGLDVNSLVSQLVAAERAGGDARLARAESDAKADISAFGGILVSLNNLKGSLTTLSGDAGLAPRAATVATGAGFTASVSSSAPLGSFGVEVKALASAHKLISGQFVTSAQVGTGTLTIEVGGVTHNLDFSAGANIDAIRDAINLATNGVGVSATIVKGDAGDALVLTASASGAAGSIKVTASGGDGGLNALVYDPGVTENLTQLKAAQDSEVWVDGIKRTASGNVITDAIEGVSLTLTQAQVGQVFDLTVASDGKTLKDNIQNFITNYNAALSFMRNASKFDASLKKAAALTGDSAVRSMTQSLRDSISSNFAQLSAMGVSTAVDGSLSFDGTKFDAAVVADPALLNAVFKDTDSFGQKLKLRLDGYTETEGLIDSRTNGLNDQLKRISKDRDAQNVRMSAIEAAYLRQFSALDAIVAQLQQTSSFLTQQLSALPTAGGG